MRGIIVTDKTEDTGGLTPAKDDNEVCHNNSRKDIDHLMGY